MGKSVMSPPPNWALWTAGVALAGSLLVISMPEIRALPIRVVLMLLALLLAAESLLRLRRSGGERAPLSELHHHLPAQQTWAESLCRIATPVAALTAVFAA